MFKRCIPISYKAHIHVIEGATFGRHHEVLVPRGFHNLLTLVSARLVIIFDAMGTLIFKASNMFLRVFLVLDASEKPWGFGAVNNFAS